MAGRKKPAEEVRGVIVSACITDAERFYVQRYVDFTGLTPSQFFRLAGVEKLVRENAMPNPLAKYLDGGVKDPATSKGFAEASDTPHA
jgi:hypothetical protein